MDAQVLSKFVYKNWRPRLRFQVLTMVRNWGRGGYQCGFRDGTHRYIEELDRLGLIEAQKLGPRGGRRWCITERGEKIIAEINLAALRAGSTETMA